MTQNLIDVKDSIVLSFDQTLAHLIGFLPSLLGAVAVLIAGWILSHFVAKTVEKILSKFGFENAVKQSGLSSVVEASGTRFSSCQVIGELSKWFVRLIFIQAAASILAMPQVTQVIDSIILFIPKVVVALVILVAGSLISRFLSNTVRGSAHKLGTMNVEFLASVTRYAIYGFALIAAFSQLEIAPNIVNILFTAFMGSIALAVGLAFGLGGRDVAAEVTRNWYESAKGQNARNANSSDIRKAG